MLPEQRVAAAFPLEEVGPNWRSSHSMKNARLTEGTARRLPTETVVVPQARIGTRLIDMPGARMRMKVTTKFAEPTVVETPKKIMPSA